MRFQKASSIKPAEVYPKTRITEINLALADLEKQKTLENQYSGLIEKADKLLGEKSYAPAKIEYTNASALKPQEKYPREKREKFLPSAAIAPTEPERPRPIP